MKRLYLISIALFLHGAAHAQTSFTVPAPPLEQKYLVTRMLMYNNILGLITVAKKDGMTAEELGKKTGEIAAWDENAGFDQFVKFILFGQACLSDSVQIVEQSNDKVLITVPHLYPRLENQDVIYGSSLEDLIAYLNAMMGEIANRLDLTYDMTWGEDGLKINIAH
jgi:hypothetical protein